VECNLTLSSNLQISAPTSLSYLGDGVLFVGSAYGDSQLAQLNTDKNDEGDYVTILDEMTNLGPITDFALVDIEKQGQVSKPIALLNVL